MPTQEEIWKPVPQFDLFYEVSNLGRVRRIAKGGPAKIGHILIPCPDACGYLRVRLCKSSSERRMCKIHRLVLSAFIGPRGPQWTTNHKNRLRDDNRLDNLEYLSHADNIRHSARSYSRPGESHPQAIFTNEDILEIRRLHATGMKQSHIAKKLGFNRFTINDIVLRKSWKHI